MVDFFKPKRNDPGTEEEPEMTPSQPESDDPFNLASFSQPSSDAPKRTSVIAEGFSFNGVFKAPSGELRVEGSVEGDIEVNAVYIGRSGLVDGQCRCDTLTVHGRFEGKAECRELHLNAESKVNGEITYSVLRAQRGAQMTGKFTHKKKF